MAYKFRAGSATLSGSQTQKGTITLQDENDATARGSWNGDTGLLTATGRIITDDTTEATSTTDGSLQTDGGLSVAKDVIAGNDVYLLTDSSVLGLGVNKDATLTHDGTTGLTIAANPVEIDSGGNITLDAHTGIWIFQDANTEVLRITEGNSGDVTVKLETNAKDLIFTDNGDAEGFRILDEAAGVKTTAISGSSTFQMVGAGIIGGAFSVTGAGTFAGDLSVGDDLTLSSDSAVFNMGAGNDFTITHDGTTGGTIAGNPIIVDSGDDLTLDAHTGIFIFKDAGSEVLRFTEGNSGDVTVKLATDGKDLVFTDNGDATNMKILDAAAGINVPGEVQTTKIAYTDGDDAMTVSDGGKITFASGFDVGSDAQGDMLYHNGTSYVRLAKGTDNYILKMNGNDPNWEAEGSGGGDNLSVSGTGDHNATLSAGVTYFASASQGANRTWTLPQGTTLNSGDVLVAKAGNTNSNYLRITCSAADTIDGENYVDINSPFGAVSMCYVGNNAFKIY
tara:strand:- start:3659 stop:5179 length:1521 start_codon:yes stop_codon:yes gene_type:complete